MKRVLFFIAAVFLSLNASTLLNAELKFQIKNVSPQYVLLLKGKSSVQTIGQDMGSMYDKIYGYLETNTINPVGPPIALYFSEPGPEWEIAVAVPVPEGTMGQGAIVPSGNGTATAISPSGPGSEKYNAIGGPTGYIVLVSK